MTEQLTKERAIELFRQQWFDMQKTLGDCPEPSSRELFKYRWIDLYFPGEDIESACFLCEYAAQHEVGSFCDLCPIEWPGRRCTADNCTNYIDSPISEILALPERKEIENER